MKKLLILSLIFLVLLSACTQSNSQKQSDKKETIKLWNEMRSWMNNNYPQCILISEWSNPAQAIPAGFNIDFFIQMCSHPLPTTHGYSHQ